MATRGRLDERLGGLYGGVLNDDGGGDGYGNGNTNAMAGHQKRVAYKEDNIICPGDGGIAAKLFPALAGIGNGERNPLPPKQRRVYLPRRRRRSLGGQRRGRIRIYPCPSEYHQRVECNTTETSKANK